LIEVERKGRAGQKEEIPVFTHPLFPSRLVESSLFESLRFLDSSLLLPNAEEESKW